MTLKVCVVVPGGEGQRARRGSVVAGARRRVPLAVAEPTVTVWPLAADRVTVKVALTCRRALGDRHVVDRQRRRGVVVGDGADALGVGDRGVDGAAQVDEERLVGLVERVADDRHGEVCVVVPGAKVSVPWRRGVVGAGRRRCRWPWRS